MGQKVNPHGLRVGVNKEWSSKWYADKNNFADYLAEDNKVRTFVKKKLYNAGVSKVVIERPAADKIKVIVLVARPGMVIGRSHLRAKKGAKSALDPCWTRSVVRTFLRAYRAVGPRL